MNYSRLVDGKPVCIKRLIKLKNMNILVREFLRINLKKADGTENITIIMMNPSIADSDTSDQTINKAVNLFSEAIIPLNENDNKIGGIKYINIVNLFPFVCAKSEELYVTLETVRENLGIKEFDKLEKSNLETIKSFIQQSDFVLLAWGNPPKGFPAKEYYLKVISVINYIIQKNKPCYGFFVNGANGVSGCVTKGGNPRHPSYGQVMGISRLDFVKPRKVIERE